MLKIKNNIITIVLSAIFFICFIYLFYKQILSTNDFYVSDITLHLEFARKGESYSALYFLMGLLLKLKNGQFFIAVLEAFFVIITWWLSIDYIKVSIHEKDKFKWVVILVSMDLLFLTSIYLPKVHPYFYRYSVCTQPWHNITYLGMRLFAIVTVINFRKIFDKYLDGIKITEWLAIALPLLLATSIKPNFLMAFSITLLIYLIIDAIKCHFKIRYLKNIIIMGTTVLPSCAILLLQAYILYGTDDSSICFILGSSFLGEGLKNIVIAILIGSLFPIWVLVFNYKDMRREEYFAYVMFLIALIEGNVLSETGERQMHGNFMWGVFLAAYIVFMVAISIFIRNLTEKKEKTYYNVIGIILLIGHLSSGLYYFSKVLLGYHYFI